MTRIEPDSHDSLSDPPGSDSRPGDHEGMRYSIGQCPICGGGLCTVRAFFDHENGSLKLTHGLVVCDECEAIWLQPDINGVHVYADSESPLCPVSGKPLYDPQFSRWATEADVASLNWSAAIDPSLTYDPRGEQPDA
ncbi:hypothetical protein [Rhodopirellula sallentina]|uniref:Uncharacterized protein n=1 Tax=Rhodopirellula sallentina SM41 TaxID=1263870 RepID=M5U8V6_9BACT|nr:hypothetical protein [Rhodopirellula sallentina]EMI54286.1 hypothetical protein RSSM_04277 [Rhodopirellula sallentina SM41]